MSFDLFLMIKKQLKFYVYKQFREFIVGKKSPDNLSVFHPTCSALWEFVSKMIMFVSISWPTFDPLFSDYN